MVNLNGFQNGAYGSKFSQVKGPAADCAPAYQTGGACADDVGSPLAQNPFAKYVLSLFPTPTNPGPYVTFDNSTGSPQNDGTNAVYQRGVVNSDNRYSFRIDHQFGNSDQIYVRYTVIPVIADRFFAVDQSS